MSPLTSRSAQAGLRTLGARSARQTALQCVATSRAALRAYATQKNETDDAMGPSFKGQMLESITSRIAREKAEREKYAKERQESASTRRWATTFGVCLTNLRSISMYTIANHGHS